MSPEAATAVEALVEIDSNGRGSKCAIEKWLTPSQRVELLTWLEDGDESHKSAAKRVQNEFGALGIGPQQIAHWHQKRRLAIARRNLAEQAVAAREIILTKSDADSVEEAVVTMLISRSMEVLNAPKITPSHYREVVGLVVRLKEQKLTEERLRLERARFELDVAELVMKHIDKLKESGALQMEDRGEAAKRIREELFGKYTKEQIEAASLSV